MVRTISKTIYWIAAAAVLVLLGCRTADLITGTLAQPTRPSAGNRGPTLEKTAPNPAVTFVPSGQASCKAGDSSAAIVTGNVTRNEAPAVGQGVQASSVRGGKPIAGGSAVTDSEGNYQVTFVCNGRACNGTYWLWLVDESNAQASPFIQFIFDDNCRLGTANFRTP
jgi:hypothetical protein